MVRVVCVLVGCAVIGTGISGAVADEPESENLVHTRHHHPHNPKHPVVLDPDRFFTDRDSDVELALPTDDESFSFVVFGDRTGGPDSGVNILADAVRDVNLLEPDLVMTVGDLIQGYSETGDWLEEKDEFIAIMNHLLCPWFPVAGNHDVYWRDQGLGGTKPPGEHEQLYEMHFGPLWYSFEHKGSHFIILYTDEGNPETGEMTFRDPSAQKMSDEQISFLNEALERAHDATHVFVFLHHPRWLGGNYGNDWDKVHEILKSAGNVRAVFAGHIHMMRADGPRDGIEYFSLATVGAHQGGAVPDAGFLHEYHVVMVRDNQIAMTAYPVGSAIDPRDVTGQLAIDAYNISKTQPEMPVALGVDSSGRARGLMNVRIDNPTTHTLSYTVSAHSRDRAWRFGPDHAHGTIGPGSSDQIRIHATRTATRPDALAPRDRP